MSSCELSNPPTDAISSVRFTPVATDPFLLVSSWDNRVRLYDIHLNTTRAVHTHTHAVLDAKFVRDSSTCISGGLARDLRQYDFEREQDFLVGKHTDAVRCVDFSSESGLIFSGSWDKTVCAWDSRTKNICHRIELEGKVFSMSVTSADAPYGKLVIGDSTKSIQIHDLRKLEKAEEIRKDVVKYQLRCIEIFANGKGFAAGTVEGRVAVEYFDPQINTLRVNVVNTPIGEEIRDSPVPQKYAFKCHRDKVTEAMIAMPGSTVPENVAVGHDKIYPINGIAFHPKYNTFATAGGDGGISIWDGVEKKRLWRISKPYVTSVTSLDFNGDGTKLALSVSYDFSEEKKIHDRRLLEFAQIIVWNIEDDYVRPKNPKAI